MGKTMETSELNRRKEQNNFYGRIHTICLNHLYLIQFSFSVLFFIFIMRIHLYKNENSLYSIEATGTILIVVNNRPDTS